MQNARGAALRFTGAKALPTGRSALVLAAGIVALLAVLAAVLADPRMALRAWLAAAFFWSGVPIGAIALLMMMRLIPGIWSSELGVAVEAATMLMPVAALVLVPVLLGTGALYPWAGEAPRTSFRGLYLSQPFFSIRSVAWFALLCVLAFLLIARRRWSTPVSCLGLIVYTVVSTFIATDWLMSLDPEFNSSGFGLYVLSIQMTVALAFCVVASLVSGSAIRKPQVLGGLLLTALMLWTYLSFMQFVIIWSGDLPAGVSWYLRRSGGGWTAVLWAIGILHGVPLLLLMLPPVLRNGRMLVGLAAATLAGKALEAAWLVLPRRDVAPEWTSVFTSVAFAGLGVLFCIAGRFAFARRVAARAPDRPIGEEPS